MVKHRQDAEAEPELVKNPKTGRWIKRGGDLYKRLVRQGLYDVDSAAEGATHEDDRKAMLPPPPEGKHWNLSKSGRIKAVKNPTRDHAATAMKAAAKAQLKAMGMPQTDDNIAAMVESIEELALEQGAGAERGTVERFKPPAAGKKNRAPIAAAADSSEESESESDDSDSDETPAALARTASIAPARRRGGFRLG